MSQNNVQVKRHMSANKKIYCHILNEISHKHFLRVSYVVSKLKLDADDSKRGWSQGTSSLYWPSEWTHPSWTIPSHTIQSPQASWQNQFAHTNQAIWGELSVIFCQSFSCMSLIDNEVAHLEKCRCFCWKDFLLSISIKSCKKQHLAFLEFF